MKNMKNVDVINPSFPNSDDQSSNLNNKYISDARPKEV
jgi:hypothetical protein